MFQDPVSARDLQTEFIRDSQNYGISVQPRVIVFGDIDLYAQLYIGSHCFHYSNALEAFQSLFYYFHSLHIVYPIQSKHVWHLIEHLIFNITDSKLTPSASGILANITQCSA